MNKKSLLFILLIISIISTLTSCKTSCLTNCNDIKNRYIYESKYYFYLDTTNLIKVEYDNTKLSKDEVKTYLDEVDNIMLNIEKEFSADVTQNMKINNYLKSTLMEVNENKETKVSDDFIKLTKLALNIAKDTSGGFDPTIGKLTKLWDISKLTEYCQTDSLSYDGSLCKIPSSETIEETLKTVNYENVILDEVNKTIILKNQAMLDFGAIAKGFAADVIMAYLKPIGFEYISIWLGGNLLVSGKSKAYEQDEKVVLNYIENPFTSGQTILSTPITDVSIVTSGTHERYIEVDNKIYHHLLSTKTGYPIDNGLALVSIIGASSATCDGLSTGVFALGLEEGINYLKNSDYDGVIVTNDHHIYIIGSFTYELSDGISDDFIVTTIKK